ncbi:MAG: hypothetical protein IJU03_11050 [Thermoguttaceae bacterium]|nr:hypothetical protein [Thermoguttaceae bacterium]
MKTKICALFAFLLLATIAVATTGCKPGNPDGRENVQGTITLNGEPIGKYTGICRIQFDPVGDDKRAGGSGSILDGKYLLTGPDGCKPGKYIVKIYYQVSYDGDTGEIATAESGDMSQYLVNYLPPEFNDASKIEFEVVAKSKNEFNYDIQTDFQPDTKAPAKRSKAGASAGA